MRVLFECDIILIMILQFEGVNMSHFIEKCQTVCNLTFQSLRIPIYLYREDALLYTPVPEPYAIPPFLYTHSLLTQAEPIFYTKYSACFARLDADEDKSICFILGPVTTLRLEDRAFSEMYRDYALPSEQWEAFRNFHLQIPTMTHLEFFYHLLTVFYMINSRVITIAALVPDPTKEEISQARQKQVETMFRQKEEQSFNNSMKLEKTLLSIVKTGNVEGIRDFINATPHYQAGIIANTPIRLHKNYFISTITLATRAAIEGGLPAEQAYRLSDLYITRAEGLSDLQAIDILFMQALNDLTVQVHAALQAQRQMSFRNTNQMVQSCMDYVQKHTHSPLTVQGVADVLGYHRSYLSSAFAKATGICLNDYIYRCKLEEGRHLLQYSTKKIGEISDALCFSNQSHFVQRFKKLYGMTPAEYRYSQR